MRKETRTRIDDPADAIRAAFALVTCLVNDPDFPDEQIDGAILKPIEQIERSEADEKEVEWAFEVRHPAPNPEGAALPEMQRILINA